MQREDQRDLKLIQRGIISILTLIYQNAPTMIYNDTINLIRLVYEYGRLNGRDEKEKELIDTYLQAIIDYELIYNAGIAVSTMVENGSDPSQIDYNKVVDYLKSEKERNRWEYISKAIASSDRNVEAWLGKIIDDQKKEEEQNLCVWIL